MPHTHCVETSGGTFANNPSQWRMLSWHTKHLFSHHCMTRHVSPCSSRRRVVLAPPPSGATSVDCRNCQESGYTRRPVPNKIKQLPNLDVDFVRPPTRPRNTTQAICRENHTIGCFTNAMSSLVSLRSRENLSQSAPEHGAVSLLWGALQNLPILSTM